MKKIKFKSVCLSQKIKSGNDCVSLLVIRVCQIEFVLIALGLKLVQIQIFAQNILILSFWDTIFS